LKLVEQTGNERVRRPGNLKAMTCGRMLRVVLLSLLVGSASTARSAHEMQMAGLWRLYAQNDFLSLRERLPPPDGHDSAELVFLRAGVLAAFHREQDSNVLLRQILAQPDQYPDLDVMARTRLMLNDRALFRYSEALAAIAPVLEHAGANKQALVNRARLLEALTDVGPQTVSAPASDTILDVDKAWCVPARVGHLSFRVLLDTAANFSALSRSQAMAAGLSIRPVRYQIGLPNGARAYADVAVGDVALGRTLVRNVVFLVLPEVRTQAPVVLGFPVLAGLGHVRFAQDAVWLERGTGAFDSNSHAADMALADGDPLLHVSFDNELLICRLDTGAARTTFYPRFVYRNPQFRRTPAAIEWIQSLAGETAVRIFTAPEVTISVAGRLLELNHSAVLAGTGDGNLDCNLGRDVLASIGSYSIDYRRMNIALR
jgi:hypothetical protein